MRTVPPSTKMAPASVADSFSVMTAPSMVTEDWGWATMAPRMLRTLETLRLEAWRTAPEPTSMAVGAARGCRCGRW